MHYQHNYTSNKRRLNLKKVSLIAAIVIVILGGTMYINRVRIQLFFKGYSFSEQGILLEVEDVAPYLDTDKIAALSSWNAINNRKHYLEYNAYLALYPNLSKEEVVSFIDTYYTNYQKDMIALGYDDKTVWKMFEYVTLDDINIIINDSVAYKDVKDFLSVKGFQITDLQKYMQNTDIYKSAMENVLMTSYSRIDATSKSDDVYQLNSPDALLALVKKGFQLPKDYEPKDLVKPDIPMAPDCTDSLLRADAAKALKEMYDAGKKEGYHLVLNSGYRSYAQQQEIYDEYFLKYDAVTAAGLVALPGSSEHQTGLGVDLTSQSVLDGERMVFGDTAEKKWLATNAYKYGFVIRYPDDKISMTGTTKEPWHYRYVGKDAAKEMYDNHWVLEEYILHRGFTYTLSKQ